MYLRDRERKNTSRGKGRGRDKQTLGGAGSPAWSRSQITT